MADHNKLNCICTKDNPMPDEEPYKPISWIWTHQDAVNTGKLFQVEGPGIKTIYQIWECPNCKYIIPKAHEAQPKETS